MAHLFAREAFVDAEVLPVEEGEGEVHVDPHALGGVAPNEIHPCNKHSHNHNVLVFTTCFACLETQMRFYNNFYYSVILGLFVQFPYTFCDLSLINIYESLCLVEK